MSCAQITNTSLELCDEDKLVTYLAQIQVLNPESIISLSTIDELPVLCNQVEDSLTDLDEYLQTCKPSQRDLYMKLIQGVDSLYNNICTNNSFADEFRKHYICYHEISQELFKCGGPDDWNESNDGKVICDFYEVIVECYYTTTTKQCGEKAANVIKDLMIKVIDSILVVRCDNVLLTFHPAQISETSTLMDTSYVCPLQKHSYVHLIIIYLIKLFVA